MPHPLQPREQVDRPSLGAGREELQGEETVLGQALGEGVAVVG